MLYSLAASTVSSTNPAAWAAVPKTASSRRMSRSARSTLPITFPAVFQDKPFFSCDEELGIAVGWKFYVSPSFHLFSYGRSGIKGVEQVFKDRMELYHAHTPVQITDKALSVFQVTEPLLVVFIFGIHPEKGEGLFEFR